VGYEGAGDVGKTFLLADLVSRIARGAVMPDGSASTEGCIVWITSEERCEEVTRRLLAAGLNPHEDHFRRVAVIATRGKGGPPLELPSDDDHVRAVAAELVKRSGVPLVLVILDPLFEFLDAQVDENSAKQVRQACAPLSHLAQDLDCTVVGLRHWNKSSSQRRRDRGAGSAQFSSTFRVQLAVFKHPDDPGIRLLACDMNRYAAEDDRPPLGFEIVAAPHYDSARIDWHGVVELPEKEAPEGKPSGATKRAMEWLAAQLASAESPETVVLVADIVQAREKTPPVVSKNAVYAAKDELGVETYKIFGGRTGWYIPPISEADPD
jgi:hypothetical protein